ncbi:MAG: transcription termination/antitermination protein NusA [Erysipelotrichaceae bacterium]|nr:transcription termination/antitermination protein NusA [Erysipelotrichaceae bacterium]
MNIKDLVSVMGNIQENRMITNEIVVESLAEGLQKAFRKHINCPDAVCRVDIDLDKGNIRLFQQRTVVEEAEDPDLEMSLDEAREIKTDAELGDILEEEADIKDFGRTTVTLVKNVMLQKIKEASKQAVYDEYIDKVFDLVYGTVQTVEEKFALIDLGKTLALLPKSEQIPGERYYDGQRLRVVIKTVSKDSKGAQVVVSRSNAALIKRLFELSVPEIYDGTVEIKAIAREAGERTKMVVSSNNENVDPVGACIGQRGSRVSTVIQEISQYNSSMHENIDVVTWDEAFSKYVINIMSPAQVVAVVQNYLPEEKKTLIVVEDDQLSLAIGKKGINARLAVKLLDSKVDIKTRSAVEEEGLDWRSMYMEQLAKEVVRKNKLAAERQAALEAQRQAEEEAMKAEREKYNSIVEEFNFDENEGEQSYRTEPKAEPAVEVTPVEEPVTTETEEVKAEPVKEEPVKTEEVKAEPVKEEEPEEEKEVVKRRKPKLEVKASDYVSKFESLADSKKQEQKASTSRKRKNTKEDEEEAALKKKLEALKNKEYEIRPEYSEEELDEFENSEEKHWYDDDFNDDEYDYDDYDSYYDN